MQHSEVKMYKPSQAPSVSGIQVVFAQIRQTTELLIKRKLDGSGVEAAIPGLEVIDSNWGEWKAALTDGIAPNDR